jgi:hypothetical protein
MQRECKHCCHQLTVHDLEKSKTMSMEADRKKRSLKGFRFRCYKCPQCGYEDLFVDVLHIPGEDLAAFRGRTEQLEIAAQDVRVPMVEVALAEVPYREASGGLRA